jgi:hypothetical protein
MKTRYAVVYRSGNYQSISSTHRFRWAANNHANAMNNVTGNSTKKLRAAEALGVPKPDAYYEVQEYEV